MIVIALVGILMFAADWQELSRVVQEAVWKPLLPALLFTVFSYGCVGLSFAMVSRMLGIGMKRHELAAIGFISTTLNHIVMSGGIAGYSVRYQLMHRRGTRMKDVLAASIFHQYLTSLDMLMMLPVGLVYLLLNATVARGIARILEAMTLVMTLVAIVTTILIFSNSLRAGLLGALGKLAGTIMRHDYQPSLANFDQTMVRGVSAIKQRPWDLLMIMFLTYADWVASVVVLGFCFDALGPAVKPGVLMSGFVIGIMSGVLSLVPGGFGVQEGSMAGIFALLGVSFEQAILAAVLFRGIYYLLPYAISLFLYWQMIRAPGGPTPTPSEGGAACES